MWCSYWVYMVCVFWTCVISGMGWYASTWWRFPVWCVMVVTVGAGVVVLEVLLWGHLWCDWEWLMHELLWLLLQYPWEYDCDLNLLYLCLSGRWCLEVDLVWCLVCHLLCCAGVPDSGIPSGQSAAMWPYSSHLKQCRLGQLHAMWLNSWHWKHWCPSLVITLTVEEGNRVAVNCCAAWSFSTSLMASVRA